MLAVGWDKIVQHHRPTIFGLKTHHGGPPLTARQAGTPDLVPPYSRICEITSETDPLDSHPNHKPASLSTSQ